MSTASPSSTADNTSKSSRMGSPHKGSFTNRRRPRAHVSTRVARDKPSNGRPPGVVSQITPISTYEKPPISPNTKASRSSSAERSQRASKAELQLLPLRLEGLDVRRARLKAAGAVHRRARSQRRLRAMRNSQARSRSRSSYCSSTLQHAHEYVLGQLFGRLARAGHAEEIAVNGDVMSLEQFGGRCCHSVSSHLVITRERRK